MQISGMSELKIKAKSTQQAIKRAVHSVYTGYIMVNGISYYVIHGIIADDKAMGVQQNQDDEKQAKHDSRSQAQKIYDKAHEFLKQLLPNYFGNE